MHYHEKILLDPITSAEVFEFVTYELSSIVRDEFMWYFKPANDVVLQTCKSGNGGERFRFGPFGKVINYNDSIFSYFFDNW